jgi:hypothetical protein
VRFSPQITPQPPQLLPLPLPPLDVPLLLPLPLLPPKFTPLLVPFDDVPLLLPLDPVPLLLPLLLAPPSSVPFDPVPCVSPPQATIAPAPPAGIPTVTMSANNLSRLAADALRMTPPEPHRRMPRATRAASKPADSRAPPCPLCATPRHPRASRLAAHVALVALPARSPLV